MDISKDQKKFYQNAREHCRVDVEQLNNTIRVEWQHINEEISRVQNLIQTLEARKQTVGQIPASASDLLGLQDDLDVTPAIKEF